MTRSLNFLHLTTFYPPYSFGGTDSWRGATCAMERGPSSLRTPPPEPNDPLTPRRAARSSFMSMTRSDDTVTPMKGVTISAAWLHAPCPDGWSLLAKDAERENAPVGPLL